MFIEVTLKERKISINISAIRYFSADGAKCHRLDMLFKKPMKK